MYGVFLIIFLVIAVALVALIMLQQSKGDGEGVFFGARSLNSFLSSGSSGSFMTRLIVILATLFFIVSLVLGCFCR